MGLIPSGNTISLEATLTDYGKQKLYESIEGGDTLPFIDSFALGDSDANYLAMENGSDVLESGHVPADTGFFAVCRSYALYSGTYRPGSPIVLKDGEDGDVYRDFSIAGGEPLTLTFQITTQWPAGELFIENYWIGLTGGSSFTQQRWNEIFTPSVINTENGTELRIAFTGNLTFPEIARLTAIGNDMETDFVVNITGKQSYKHTQILFRITY